MTLFFNSGPGDCSCIDFTAFVDKHDKDFGNCLNSGPDKLCYVKEPSTCSDVKNSSFADHRYSRKACNVKQGYHQ